MRSIFYLAFTALAAVVAAQSTDNAFNNPAGGYQFAAGRPTQLSWAPSTDGTVTLKLQKGDNTTPSDGIIIAGTYYI
ncbi:lysophospholipase [Blastomyces silverae]|uniref:Lysophospholipase n=1 Tax=Blastomyces silverae TaxID=2060906 RepID=A0A0H1B8R5_9EURO|nr:lysophospholipase [Blastomyces silverae]